VSDARTRWPRGTRPATASKRVWPNEISDWAPKSEARRLKESCLGTPPSQNVRPVRNRGPAVSREPCSGRKGEPGCWCARTTIWAKRGVISVPVGERGALRLRVRFAVRRRYSCGGSAERAQQRGPTAAVEPSDVKQWILVAGRGVRGKRRERLERGLRASGLSSDPYPSLPLRDASPVSIGKDGYQSNDEDDPKPGRHGDPFLRSVATLRRAASASQSFAGPTTIATSGFLPRREVGR
jgi:hypothetical protein